MSTLPVHSSDRTGTWIPPLGGIGEHRHREHRDFVHLLKSQRHTSPMPPLSLSLTRGKAPAPYPFLWGPYPPDSHGRTGFHTARVIANPAGEMVQ